MWVNWNPIDKKFLEYDSVVCAYDNDENNLFNLQKELEEFSDRFRPFLGDLRDRKRVEMACEGVDFIFHCAALKHVAISEYNPFEAVKTNVIGCQNLIQAAIGADVDKVIFTSSDKAVNPTGTMGATKLIGEKLFIAGNNYVGKKGPVSRQYDLEMY